MNFELSHLSFSWLAWVISAAAVLLSGLAAWLEGSWSTRPGLHMGFVNHAGMWDDLVLLSVANALVVPHLTFGWWIGGAAVAATVASLWVHKHWYRGNRADHSCEHMWPARPRGSWYGDLSWAGWLHVLYVIGELTLLIGFLLHVMPPVTVAAVVAIFTIHLPIGLLQPRWFMTGRIASVAQQPLLVPCLIALWVVGAMKLV